ncbi:MAG: hypothetical protein WD894_20055 [Pirellulales bacterium]
MLHAGKLPPGAIGAQQLLRGGPLPGYFQPAEIKAPEGAFVSLAVNQEFSAPQTTPLKVGMLIAPVYRLRVTQIPNHLGEEVYPTIEIINRIYPPVGEEFRFPVPIELTQADLELALSGKFVTRVVYLEDPQQALPVAPVDDEQRYFEVRPSDDPLEVADRLGRPVAIIRLGGRLPDATGPDPKFLFGSPPLMVPNSLALVSELSTGGEGPTRDSPGRSLPPRQTAPWVSEPASDPKAQRAVTTSSPTVRLAATRSVLSNERAPDGRPVVSLAADNEWKPNKPAPVAVSISDDE